VYNPIFSFMSVVVPILIIGIFIVFAVKLAVRWTKNNNSPIVPVQAKIVAKRAEHSSSYMNGDITGASGTMHHTSYYTTFEFINGERLEISVAGDEYGLLAEGDEGILSFQGTRFIGFERQ